MSVIRYRDLATGTWKLVELPAGPKGLTGDKGAKGLTGDAGATGSKGPIGDTGAKGATGDRGATGATGATGPRGYDGDPSSGSYGTQNWQFRWGSVNVSCAAGLSEHGNYGYGYNYTGANWLQLTLANNNLGQSGHACAIGTVNSELTWFRFSIYAHAATTTWVHWCVWGY